MNAASEAPIGLLGGSFDPIHNGHLRIALEAVERLGLGEVRLLPLNRPGHRTPGRTSVEDRAAMVAAAVTPPLRLDRREIERGGTTYTIDTLGELRGEYPARSLYLLIGLDSYLTLPTWHRAEELLDLAHIIVAARGDTGVRAAPGLDELIGTAQCDDIAALGEQRAGRVLFLDTPQLPIASSDLRQRIADGRSIRYLVPDAVADYIEQRALYQA